MYRARSCRKTVFNAMVRTRGNARLICGLILRQERGTTWVATSLLVPNHPDESVLIERVTSSDPDLIMPPPDSGKKTLSDAAG